VSVEIVRFASLPAMPWKNGLGTTTQLAIHPRGANANTFGWRISIAALAGTAPFSVFDGIERCLAMLEGEVTLLREAQPEITLTPASPPLTFSGNELITGRVTGAALDLNLMYRPSGWQATLRKIVLHEPARLSGDVTMLCALAPLHIDVAERRIELERYDLLRVADVAIVARSGGAAYAIELRERR
jgi:environmental stress-induced protein Ves